MRAKTGCTLIGISLLFATGFASAGDFGDRVDHRFDRIGAHREQVLDRKGERIDARYDRRAERAEALGHAKLADRLEQRGDRIEARYDKRGERAENRWDRRGDRFDRRWDRRH